MKQILDEYSPILEGVEVDELVKKVRSQPDLEEEEDEDEDTSTLDLLNIKDITKQ